MKERMFATVDKPARRSAAWKTLLSGRGPDEESAMVRALITMVGSDDPDQTQDVELSKALLRTCTADLGAPPLLACDMLDFCSELKQNTIECAPVL